MTRQADEMNAEMLRQKLRDFAPHSAMHGPTMQQNEIGPFTKRFNVKAH